MLPYIYDHQVQDITTLGLHIQSAMVCFACMWASVGGTHFRIQDTRVRITTAGSTKPPMSKNILWVLADQWPRIQFRLLRIASEIISCVVVDQFTSFEDWDWQRSTPIVWAPFELHPMTRPICFFCFIMCKGWWQILKCMNINIWIGNHHFFVTL